MQRGGSLHRDTPVPGMESSFARNSGFLTLNHPSMGTVESIQESEEEDTFIRDSAGSLVSFRCLPLFASDVYHLPCLLLFFIFTYPRRDLATKAVARHPDHDSRTAKYRSSDTFSQLQLDLASTHTNSCPGSPLTSLKKCMVRLQMDSKAWNTGNGKSKGLSPILSGKQYGTGNPKGGSRRVFSNSGQSSPTGSQDSQGSGNTMRSVESLHRPTPIPSDASGSFTG